MRSLFVLLVFLPISFVRAQEPDAAGKEATERVCSACHEVAMAVAERHTPDEWKDIVSDMRRRGAEASDSEQKAILAYLTRNFGKAAEK